MKQRKPPKVTVVVQNKPSEQVIELFNRKLYMLLSKKLKQAN